MTGHPSILPRIRLGILFLTGAATSLASGADPVTIRFATGSGGDGLKNLRATADAFEAAHPDIRVKIEPVVGNEYENKLLAQFAAGVAPDCASFNGNRIVAFASRNALRPLNGFTDIDSPEVDIKGRYPNIVEAFSSEGKLFALPRDIACSAYIYYNKRAFREAGIPFPDGSWTWDTRVRPELKEKDFVWTMQRLTKTKPGEKRPHQFGFGPAWPQLWMQTLLISSGVRMWDRDEDPSKFFLNDPKVVEVFEFAADVPNRHRWMPSNNDVTLGAGSTMQDEFRKGNIAMLQSGSWEIRDMRLKHKGEWDIAPFPRFARGKTGYLPGEGTGIGIFASSKHPDEAWKWIKWLCGRPGLEDMAQKGESQPSIRELAKTPGLWLPARGEKVQPEHIAITDEIALRVRNQKLPDWFTGIDREITGSFYAVLAGERSAKDMLSELQRKMPGKLALARRRVDAPPYPFWPAVAFGVFLVAALIAWVYLPERGIRRTRVEKAESQSAYRFLIPWFCGLTLTLGPMIYSLLLSFAESDIIQTPKWRGVGNYADLMNPAVDDTLFVSLRQTLIFASLSIPLGMATALGLALLLNQKIRGVPLFRALFYLPSLASGVALSLVWMRLFDRDRGIINALLYGNDGSSGFLGIGPALSRLSGTPGEPLNWLGNSQTVIPAFIIMGLWGAGGGTIIFLAGLQGISPTYYEAATLDGAGIWRKFRNVTLPLLTPTLFFSSITGVIGALQVFSEAFVITGGGPDRATLFTMVWLYGKAFGELQMGYASAIAWILFTIILLLTVVQLSLAKRWVFYEGELK
ncbi:extracellular solute-binding protein [bacterium]|nr:MAG: extracellular solute-binding protein [bacterium]